MAKETPTKAANNLRGNTQSRDKKDHGSTSEEVRTLACYIEYTSIGTAHAQATNKDINPLDLHDSLLAISYHQSKK